MKKTFEAQIDNAYTLEFSHNVWGDVTITGWARKQGTQWQWFNGKFPFAEKYENTREWKNAWDKAINELS